MVDINCKDDSGTTPLHIAVKQGDCEIIEILLKNMYMVDSNCKDNYGRTPLHIAAEQGDFDIMEILLKNMYMVDSNCKDNSGMTPLHIAAEQGDFDIMEILLKNNSNVDVVDAKDNCYYGYTPLQYALRTTDIELFYKMVNLLLQYKANIDEIDNFGRTLLYNAVLANYEKAQFLISFKPNANVKAKDGKTLLHCAVEKGYIDIVKYLLENGATIDDIYIEERPPNRYSVLQYACMMDHYDIFELLLDHGANTNLKLTKGRTVFHFAVKQRLTKYIECIFRKRNIQ